ncbi:MAG TPA: M20 family metallopeptidase [Thermomicrobiales bacterium]|nr:M20 family metallopeptidase [Thermomicrobiales bacterium]
MSADPSDQTQQPFDRAAAERVLAEINQDEVISFLQGLVRIPSVHEPGDTREATAYCAEPLARAGFATRMETLEEIKPNLVAEYGDPDTGPTVMFNAHVDVVPTGELSAWQFDPWGAEIDNGRVYGRGSGDDKASVTAQVMAGVALARSGVALKGRLIVNEVADEEIGGIAGAKWLAESGILKPDFAIVGEQTMGRVNVGEKGGAGQTITVYGRAAHGALPWEGANAIEGMAEILVALRKELWPKLAERTHKYFHPSSASPNLITGGVKSNVVADRCEMFVDRRLVPGETVAGTRAEIREIAERVISQMPGLRVEVEGRWMGLEASLTPDDHPLIRSMVGANAFLGYDTTISGFSMGTDGRFFSQRGVPTIIYGPGDPRLAHIPNEWVGIDEVMDATRAYALAGLSLLS